VTARALVSHDTISGWGGIDPARGVVVERHHELCGVGFAGTVLVFPGAKGSSGWSGFFQACRLAGTAPAAMLVTTTTTKSALGAVVTRVPSLSDFDVDPVTVIRTGDLVTVDADAGTVTVHDPRDADPPGGGG
jgi:hypothetical protein